MLSNSIISLLSNHRDLSKQKRPNTLNRTQIVRLVRESISPDRQLLSLQEKICQTLQELEAQGEILASKGNYYCIAPPTLLANSREDVAGIRFRGDRAYLSLAHERLNSRNQNRDEVKIHPTIRTFDRIQAKLDPIGIRLLTAEDLIHRLPSPQKPPKYVLRCPITLPDSSDSELFGYEPLPHTLQENRWQPIIISQISTLVDRSLLILTKDRHYQNDRYFYWKSNELYDLDRDVAILAMFDKDRETNSPLRVSWHTSEGKLDLRDIYLPSAYMRYLWQLSVETEQYRVRFVPAVSRSLIEPVFQRLGCLLV
jgi:hypothetical protein